MCIRYNQITSENQSKSHNIPFYTIGFIEYFKFIFKKTTFFFLYPFEMYYNEKMHMISQKLIYNGRILLEHFIDAY